MQRTFLSTACLLAATAVLLGAMGAHFLKEKMTADYLTSFETGLRFQFYHALALLLVGILMRDVKNKFIKWSAQSFIAGIIFFSGSLYLLSIHELIGMENYKWLGPITPLGGLCFTAGWIFLFMAVRKKSTMS